jgi:methionyl-tRNA formyltransferase
VTAGRVDPVGPARPRLRVAFFGLPLAAVLLAGDGHEIVYAAACRRALGLRRLSTRIAPGRTQVRPDATSARTLARVKAAAPDLLVSWFWTTKLPAALLELAPSVGVHPSLLPRHRGPDPCFWAIDAGDAVTGVTAHRLAVEYDTGDILARRELPIDPAWNGWQLARALDRPSLGLLRDVVRAYADGRPPISVAQDETSATPAPEPSDEDLAIRWSWPAARLERRVRAAAPWPGAWTEIGDALVTLTRVRVTRDFPKALEPAEAAVRKDGVAVVRAGDHAVELHEGRLQGESERDDAGEAASDQALGARELADLVSHCAQR